MAKTAYNEQERHRVGELLKKLRQEQEMSLRDIGEKAGMSHANVDKVERGVYSTTLDVLTSIAQALGVKVTFEKM